MFAMVSMDSEETPTIVSNPIPIPPSVATNQPPGRLFFLYGAIKHLVWAALLAGWGSDIQATPVAALLKMFNGPTPLMIVLAFSSVVAFIGIFSRSTLTKVVCLTPQQALMSMTFVSCLSAVILGQYADGVPRPHMFILADQLPAILAAIFHTIALILLAKRV
jgi:hypothetical protein